MSVSAAVARPGTPVPGDPVHDWLRRHAQAMPAETGFVTCRSGEVTERVTYSAAASLVDDLARGLAHTGVRARDRVVLSLPNEPSFALTLLACLTIGAIAVPAPTPTVTRTDAFRERISGIVADCGPALVVTDAAWSERLADLADCPTTSWTQLRTEGEGSAAVQAVTHPIALLQYTSGSTKRPRGIVITHDTLAASCAQAAQVYRERVGDVAVTWVPLYHDMGLVTGVMRPLYTGYRSILLSPNDFVRDPASWPTAVSMYGGTLSSAPNFAYELCVRKVDAARAAELDLRSWRVARNAGEVVRAHTMDRFAAHFAAAGFSPAAFAPSYGLAEATLAVTTCGPGVPPLRLTVDPVALQRAEIVPSDSGVPLLSSGVPLPGTDIVIRGRGVGTIAVSGPQLSPGQWREKTDARQGRWHVTGDLGFVHSGHLFVLGRADDTVVFNGKNYFLSDVVAACAAARGVRPGRIAPFVVVDPVSETPTVQVVAELVPGITPDSGELVRLSRDTKRLLVSALELFVSRVDFVAAGGLPVTTSGKVRVSETRRRFEAGRLPLLGGA